MSFGVGIGDCVRVIELIDTIVETLRHAGKASSEFQALTVQLATPRTALQSSESIELDDTWIGERMALQHASSQCQWTINDFWKRMSKHVDMSMVIDRRTFQGSACPGCRTIQMGPENKDIECSVCGINFRRVIKSVSGNRERGLIDSVLGEHSRLLRQSPEFRPEHSGPRPLPHNCAKTVDDIQIFSRVRVTALDFGRQALVSTVENAEDIAVRFGRFANLLPEAREEITKSISILQRLVANVSDIISVEDVADHYLLEDLVKNWKTALLISLDFTFKDIHRLFGFLAGPRPPSVTNVYKSVWEKIADYFLAQSGETLALRLEQYSLWALFLSAITKR